MCNNWLKKLLDSAERARELAAVYATQGFRELALDFVYQLGASGLALDSQRSGRRHHATAIGRMVDAADQPIGFEAVDQLRNVGTNARHLGGTLGEAQRLAGGHEERQTRQFGPKKGHRPP